MQWQQQEKDYCEKNTHFKTFFPIPENQDMNYYVKQTNQTKQQQQQNFIKTTLKFKEKLVNPSDLCNTSNIVQGKWNIRTSLLI